jgi:anti-sigma factor RsiW
MMNPRKATLQTMTDFTDQELRDWLLHRLDPTRAAELEERLFSDPDLADAIDAARYDLLDDHVRGRLSSDDTHLVAQHLAAAPDDAVRLRIARALAASADTAHSPPARSRVHAARRRFIALGAALAGCIVVAVVVLGLRDRSPMQTTESIASLPVITLRDDQQRSAHATLILPYRAGDVRVQAEVDEPVSQRYELRIGDARSIVFTARDLLPRVAGPYRFVETVVPANALNGGERQIDVLPQDSPDARVTHWSVRVSDPP